MKTKTTYEYMSTLFLLEKRYLIFASPKKYQPIIVEKAKKRRATATNIVPNCPIPCLNANYVNVIPVIFPSIGTFDNIIRAVIVSIINVSKNTPNIATIP